MIIKKDQQKRNFYERDPQSVKEIRSELKRSRMCLRCGDRFVDGEPKICSCENPCTIPADMIMDFTMKELQDKYRPFLDSNKPRHLNKQEGE